ncbi:PAS domain S-box protein [bacterium]|nr:PAS domain S-box protein [bacterium]
MIKDQNFNLKSFDRAVLEGKATWWEMELPSGSVSFGESKTNMLGYDEKDFNNYKDFTSIVHPEDHEKIMQDMRDHLSGEKELYETNYRIKTKGGEYIRFYDCGKIVSKEDGKITLMGFVWRIEDLSNSKEEIKKFKDIILKGNPSVIDLVNKIR